MKPFDLLNAPLTGSNLIEASAGTGKTYTIAGIYLRLLLESDIPSDQILVVTFTRAATEELKDRIRRKLVDTNHAISAGESDDPLIRKILDNCRDRENLRKRILETLVEFDRAPIFTIHGFCQRMLNENAFETATLFDFDLLNDPAELIREVAADDWRRNFVAAEPEFICHCAAQGITGPEWFVRLFRQAQTPEMTVIPPSTHVALTRLADFRDRVQAVMDTWAPARRDAERLLMDPALSGNVYGGPKKRLEKVAALLEAMDRYVENGRWLAYPVWPGLSLFRHRRLAESTKKNHTTPDHPFFHLCDRLFEAEAVLGQEMEAAFVQRKRHFLETAGKEFDGWKKKRDALVFEDLLIRLRDALRSERKGNGLASALRKRFRVALLDEFQDTDHIQYRIFSSLFEDPAASLFMIGDPKQSIYGFRGADIFSYLNASRRAAFRYTLQGNWRSSPPLITAVNSIFSSRANPFVYAEIPFRKESAAREAAEDRFSDPAAMVVWYLEGPGGATLSVGDAERRAVRAVTDEICRLTDPASDADRSLSDIAVLVRTNRQAKMIRRTLERQGVPSVLHGAGNVFHTPAAVELERVLAAVLEPGNEMKCRAALVTDMLGCRAADSLFSETGGDEMAERLERFHQYSRTWAQAGFIRMLTRLVREEGVRKRLLTFFDGERRLTNLVQLSEILHRESLQNRKGMNGLLNWMRGQMAADAAGGEAYELRLESDAPAVTITTIHRSKGLEYPVVFCPFLWDRPLADSGEIQFHDPRHDHRITLDLGSERFSEHRELAAAEMLAENLRILYVALTRAKERCYLVWGNTRYAEQSAFGYLLLDTGGDCNDCAGAEGGGTGSSIRSALKLLEDRSEGRIAVRSTPDPAYLRYAPAVKEKTPLRCAEFNGWIERGWRISSFSGMVSESRDDVGTRDHDFIAGLESIDGGKVRDAASPDPGTAPSIFDFPKGARAGTFFHEIFERIDFSKPDESALEKEIAAALARYGYALDWKETVLRMVENVLRLPLIGPRGSFSLQQIENANRINEMGFTFPMADFETAALRDILRGCPAEIEPAMPEFIENMEKLRLSQPGGYMKGFIDLVFAHDDRYYIVDWKSNHLGEKAGDYQGSRIRAAMASHYYPLQYHIYTLALHLMLKQRIPGYRYDRHFGGVWYIFIRGVSDDTGSKTGIFQDRPDFSVIKALEELMIPTGCGRGQTLTSD